MDRIGEEPPICQLDSIGEPLSDRHGYLPRDWIYLLSFPQ